MARKLALLLAPLIVTAAILLPGIAHADVNDFVINDFTADYTLTNQDKQGTLEVRERLTITFSDNNHGILRALPEKYKDQSLRLKIGAISYGDGSTVPHTTYKENDNLVLKIGDPNKTVTGLTTYDIRYTVNNVIGFYDGYSELYWDINGDQWDQPFEHVGVSLHLPAGLTVQSDKLHCFTGSFGSDSRDCTIQQAGTDIHASTLSPLSASETLTIVAGFDEGYFMPLR